MKKKVLLTICMALCLVVLCVAIAGCKAKQEHKFAEGWTYDETGHWHACTGENCEEKGEFAAHVYDNDADTTCNVCGYARAAHVHAAATAWSKDETNHWRECTVSGCNEQLDKAAHTWDEGAITTEATFVNDGVKTYTCTVCAKTRTESVAFECAEVPFEKSTVADKTYATITITDDTIGTYYFKYNVSDVSMDKTESYWIVVNKVGGGLTQNDVNNCKIYDANKQTIKDTIYTQAAGQFMATREGTGEEYDDAETMAKLKAEGTHYFQMTFHSAGEYQIQVTHFGYVGSNAKWAIQTTFATSFTSEKCSINSGNDKWFAIDLTQEIIDAINASDISGMFLDRDGNRISTVTIKAYDSEMNELKNDAIAEGETESDSLYVEKLKPGRYYICVHATATCYGYLSISVC